MPEINPTSGPGGHLEFDNSPLETNNRALIPVRPRYAVRPAAHAAKADEETLITPRFALRVFWQWWYILLPIAVLLAAGSATAVLFFFTPVYRAVAVLQIASFKPYIAYEAREPLDKAEEFVETQIELLQSGLVLEPVVRKPEIAAIPELRGRDDAAAWLAERVYVAQIGRSELYEVSFLSAGPERAAAVVNAVIDAYMDVRKRDEEARIQKVVTLLDQENAKYEIEIAQLRERMHLLSRDLTGRDPFTELPTGKGAARIHPLESLQDRLSQAEVDRKMLEVEAQALKEMIEDESVLVPEVELEMAVGDSDEIRDLRSLIATKRANLHRTESTAAQGKQDRSYLRLRRELDELERQLDRAVHEIRPQVKKQLTSIASLSRQDTLDQIRKKLEVQQMVEDTWRQKYEQQLAEVSKSDGKSLEFEFTRSELQRIEKIFEVINERRTALTTESRAPGRVSLLRSAEPPEMPVESIPIRNLALAILTSGTLPFGLVLLWEVSIRRITDSEQIVQKSDLAVVGEVAKLPLRTRLGGNYRSRSLSLFEESIDSLRVGLWLPEERKDLRVLAVASAVHAEGKTSVASQLAVSVARSTSELTLLIDADMRSPDIYKIFGIPNEPGLTKVLDKRCSIDEAIITTWSDRIHLLPAGRLHKSPHKLLGGPAMLELLNQLRQKYRYLVVDTPPILSAAEALLLAKLADGTILCTRRNYSRERQVRMAYDKLVAAGARPLGAVFNAVPTRRYAYTYGSYDYSPQVDEHV